MQAAQHRRLHDAIAGRQFVSVTAVRNVGLRGLLVDADDVVHAATVPGNADDRRVRRLDRLGRQKISKHGQAGPAFEDELLSRVAVEVASIKDIQSSLFHDSMSMSWWSSNSPPGIRSQNMLLYSA